MRGPAVFLSLVWVSAAFASEAPKGFTPLFNGKDLEGWHGWAVHAKGANPHDMEKMPPEEKAKKIEEWNADVKKHWVIKDGEVVNDGGGAYLATDKSYGDIELLIDWKIEKNADSGIYLRGVPQVQMWDPTNPKEKKNDADKGSGGLWNNTKGTPGRDPLVLADKPTGEWNHFRIIMVGERVTVWLNDKLVVDHARLENYFNRKLPLLKATPILLQTHPGVTCWKNAFIREIPATEANAILAAHATASAGIAHVTHVGGIRWKIECLNRVWFYCGDEATARSLGKILQSEVGGSGGFQSVFNGKDFAGWDGDVKGYEIVDGAIQCKPKSGGNVFTKEIYQDFVATMEIKLPPGGNNGLGIRYPGQGDGAYTGMCELQVLDDGHEMYKKIDPRQAHGSAYGMVPAHRGYLRPTGEWNFEKVTVKGPKIIVELNGTQILDADLSKVTEFMANHPHPGKDIKEGHFGFLGHNDPVAFRNIMIKKLNP